MEVFLKSFFIIFIGEIGDKSQLLVFLLAVHFRQPVVIFFGVAAAILLNNSLAVFFGSWVTEHIPTLYLKSFSILLFVGFAVSIFLSAKSKKANEREAVQLSSARGAFLTSFLSFFVAEMGDKTQIAAAALSANLGQPLLVLAGTSLAMLTLSGIPLYAEERLMSRVPVARIKKLSAFLFLAMAIYLTSSLFL